MAVRFDNINIANQVILNGICFSNEHHKCQITIHEPVRCMRCQRYGHIVRDCTNLMDTCGSCGSNHQMSKCNKLQHGVRWCVSCKATDHCSWDRDCPEKGRKQAQINTRFPEITSPSFRQLRPGHRTLDIQDRYMYQHHGPHWTEQEGEPW